MDFRDSGRLSEPLLRDHKDSGLRDRDGIFPFPGGTPATHSAPPELAVDIATNRRTSFQDGNRFEGWTGDGGHLGSPTGTSAGQTPSDHPIQFAHEDMAVRLPRPRTNRSLRNPIERKSLVRRAAHTAAHYPTYFLYNLMWGLVLWPKWTWQAMRSNDNLTILSLKSGVASGLASVLCVIKFPPPYTELSNIAIWAVVTTDILYEGNIGLSLSKGVNRVAGTFSAGALAVMLTQLGPDVPTAIYPYFVVFFVFLGGAVFRFLKGIPPLKEQWGYAFTVATIAFHILLIGSFRQPERVSLPLLRFLMILLGSFIAVFVNLGLKPVFAGDTLHKLVAKNFQTAASVLLRCVMEYNNSTILDHVPDILSGRSVDDKIHQSYHEIVMSDSDIDKLLNAVHWEPCHGPFFIGYPWDLYDDITDYLRYTLYDVIALDSCLRANVQAPKQLRDIFAQEMSIIAIECAKVLNTLARCMNEMQKFSANDILAQAEEAAVSLQYKIYVHSHLLLSRGAAESPRYSLFTDSNVVRQPDSFSDAWKWYNSMQKSTKGQVANLGIVDAIDSRHEGSNLHDNRTPGAWQGRSDPVPVPGGGRPPLPTKRDSQPSNSYLGKEAEQTDGTTLETTYGSPLWRDGVTADEVEEKNRSSSTTQSNLGWKKQFMQRKSSLGRNWDGTLERISALSLVKFASLLIEIVAKMRFVVDSVDELSQIAKFKELGE